MADYRREVSALVGAAEGQGFRVRQTRNGWMVYAKIEPGRLTVGAIGCVTVHRTPSDVRAVKNARAELRKIGVKF